MWRRKVSENFLGLKCLVNSRKWICLFRFRKFQMFLSHFGKLKSWEFSDIFGPSVWKPFQDLPLFESPLNCIKYCSTFSLSSPILPFVDYFFRIFITYLPQKFQKSSQTKKIKIILHFDSKFLKLWFVEIRVNYDVLTVHDVPLCSCSVYNC